KGYRSFAEYEHRDSPGPKPAPRVAHVRVSNDYPTYSVPQEQHPPRESRPYRAFSSTSPR
ncbi:MAG: hypothetical protein ACYTGX_12050, partial [Planctomycetota bacterium]